MIIAFILAFFIGVFSVLLFQAFLLYKWWTSKAADPRKLYPQRTRVTNPEDGPLTKSYKIGQDFRTGPYFIMHAADELSWFVAEYSKKDSATEKESCMTLNLLLAFLWREWRDSSQMRAFFLKKMNLEFSDMMQGRAASRLIEQITIEEFSLGSSLPVIKGATVMKLGADPREVPQELDIALDLEYSGGCHMAIRVDMLFNKSVYLAIKLVYMKGRARLQLSRHPLTHWSLAFYEEPEVEFEAESQFEGKNLPQLTSLIISHLRKSIQKKHTLPSYKIRYHPFFRNLSPQDETQELYVHNSLVTVGTLKVSVLGCTRLPEIENGQWYYCTLSVDIFPWSQLAENRRAMWPSFEIEISRDSTDISFGLTLSKEVSEDDLGKTIVINTIVGSSPAFVAGVMTKDLLVAVDGQKIESLKQAAKMIKSKLKFTATVQRPPSQIAQPTGKENSINQDGTDTAMVNFKNVTVSNESDSDDEFVNIVVPLLEPHADSELEKSTVREILSRSTELKQKAGKKLKGKQGKKASPALSDIDKSSTPRVGLEQGSGRTGSPGKDSKSEMGARTITDQDAQEVDKKDSPSQANALQPPGSNQRKVPVSSFSALDGFDNKKTKDVPARSDPEWNETVEFKILKKDQYLNVCVWSKSQEKNEKNILVGYVTVPLMEIALQCVLVGSKSSEECFVLVSPHSDRVISSHPHLRNHSGLKENLCCGDITLCFQHTPSLADCDESILKKMVSLDNLVPQNEGKDPLESLEPPQHQFILTQFYFPTRCRYCSKKVWTNVALQCRTCSMICHKKCLRSCMRYTHCIHANSVEASWFSQRSTTSQEDDKIESDEENKQIEKKTKDGLLASVIAESADHDPETEKGDESESATKEKAEEEQTVRQPADANKLETSGNERSGTDSDIEITSEKVREAGRELFTNLSLEDRKNKLQDMVDKLQIEIDEESVTRTELYEDRAQAKNKKRKAFIDSQLAKSEERSQALALLMLQYCAGLQSCAEVEELETCQL